MTGKRHDRIPQEIMRMLDSTPATEDILDVLTSDQANLESDPTFVAEYLKAQFVNDILVAMDEAGMSQSELAARLGESRQYVSRILKEQANFTLETLAKFACALGLRIDVTLHHPNEQVTVVPVARRRLSLQLFNLPLQSADEAASVLRETVTTEYGVGAFEVRDGQDFAA